MGNPHRRLQLPSSGIQTIRPMWQAITAEALSPVSLTVTSYSSPSRTRKMKHWKMSSCCQGSMLLKEAIPIAHLITRTSWTLASVLHHRRPLQSVLHQVKFIVLSDSLWQYITTAFALSILPHISTAEKPDGQPASRDLNFPLYCLLLDWNYRYHYTV